MSNETKKEEAKDDGGVKRPLPTPKEVEFEKRAKMYRVEVELLQKKFSIIERPIITPYGPDLQLMDARQIPGTQPNTK